MFQSDRRDKPNEWCSRRGFEPAPNGLRPFGDNETLLNEFREFCRIDLQLSSRTFHDGHVPITRRFLRTVEKPVSSIQVSDVREYLSDLTSDSEAKTYNNYLCGLKRFFRDFLQRPDLISTFRFAPISEKPISVRTKEELQRFYAELDATK
jgi:integrase